MKTRLDRYCREVLRLETSSGSTKYPHLKNVVKTALVLPYGNADIERGVSVNNRVVTAERNKLGDNQWIKSNERHGKVNRSSTAKAKGNVPINSKILCPARSAYSVY